MTDNRERLENDRAALACLLRLAEWAAESSKSIYGGYNPAHISSCFHDGAGGIEPDAVVAWVRGELAAVDLTLDALDGAVGHDCRYVCEVCGVAPEPCATCGRIDLPLHYNRICAECADKAAS